MGRLTKRTNSISHAMCGNVIIAKCEHCEDKLRKCYMEDCVAELEVTQKLAHYEDLEEQGRLIELPCAVGDIVWTYDIAGGKSYIYEYRTPNEPMCILVKDLWGIKFFATKEEAEAKLKELEGGAV